MHRRAFTLVELLVVIAIIGLLSTVAVLATSSSREKARLTAGVAFSSDVNRAIGSSVAAEYLFEEGAGTSTADASGNGNTGTLVSGVAWSTDTYGSGSAYSLLFSGNYVSAARGFGIGDSNFTFTFWIKTVSANGQMYVLNNTGSGNGYRFGLSGGRIGFLIGNGPNSESTCGTQTANDGKWHHVAGVFNRSDLQFSCYLDGHLLATIALPSAYPGMSDNPARIGTTFCCSSFAGQLDEVRVYAQNLAGASIKSLYDEEKTRFALADVDAIMAEHHDPR